MTDDTPQDTQRPDARRSKRGCLLVFKLLVFVCTLALICGTVAAVLAFMAYQHVVQPGVPGEEVVVMIPEGAYGDAVAKLLAEEGLVEHDLFFRAALRLDHSQRPIKHGGYKLRRGLSALELLHVLQEGETLPLDPSDVPDELKLTIPEGLSLAQAAALFERPEAFLEAASDPQLRARLDLTTETLEGFLMPNTYYFSEKPGEREAVERMVAQFEQEFDRLLPDSRQPLAYDKLAVVTIASLVEEEARVDEERAEVAAVIYNRLKKKMPLQMDSTLQYALGKYGQRLLYEDRDVDSPYNTYQNRGLPPGPISSPGAASLKAAMQPADVDYLFFVSNADGKTHTFSTSEADHVKAVRRYRREIAEQRRRERADD